MKCIFLDLEMNNVSKEFKAERKTCLQEIIEFGAVCLDETNNEISTFQSYVRPDYNTEVAADITKLTGIETSQVKEADRFADVFERFLDWCGSGYEIYSWSDSDPMQLQREMSLKNIAPTPRTVYMFMQWSDLQKTFDDLFFCERRIGLKMAIANAGLSFRGKMHSALGDATATADIYREMKQGKSLKKINDMLNGAKKPLTTNLGELLNGLSLQTA